MAKGADVNIMVDAVNTIPSLTLTFKVLEGHILHPRRWTLCDLWK